MHPTRLLASGEALEDPGVAGLPAHARPVSTRLRLARGPARPGAAAVVWPIPPEDGGLEACASRITLLAPAATSPCMAGGRDHASVRAGGRRRSPRRGGQSADRVQAARASRSTGRQTAAGRKAADGPPRLGHISAGTSASALPASTGPPGKWRASQAARAVWKEERRDTTSGGA